MNTAFPCVTKPFTIDDEPDIIVDGVRLNAAQAMTVRVALTSAFGFDDEHFVALGEIGPLYRARANEVLMMMKCHHRGEAR